jgi:hypothetical protein
MKRLLMMTALLQNGVYWSCVLGVRDTLFDNPGSAKSIQYRGQANRFDTLGVAEYGFFTNHVYDPLRLLHL